MMIDWAKLGDAVEFYKAHGYKYVETPWMVPSETCMITCPKPENLVEIRSAQEDWALVGSAEQGFLQRVKDNTLTGNHFVSCGPCFRNEPVFDEWHQPQFMKVELFSIINNDEESGYFVQRQMDHVREFMATYTDKVTVVNGDNQGDYDLEVNGIEVGSYGFRRSKVCNWVYGTGIAEPRFTQAINHA